MRETFWSKIRELFAIRRNLRQKLAAERKEKERWQDEYARKVSEHENTKGICDVLEGKLQECRDAAYRMDWDWFKAEFEGKAKPEKAIDDTTGQWKEAPNFPKVVITESGAYVGNANDNTSAKNFIAAHNAELAAMKRELTTYRSFAKGEISDEMCEIASGAYEAGKADQRLDDIVDSIDGSKPTVQGHDQKPSGSAQPSEHERGPKDEGPGLQTLDPGAEGRSV